MQPHLKYCGKKNEDTSKLLLYVKTSLMVGQSLSHNKYKKEVKTTSFSFYAVYTLIVSDVPSS